MTLLDDRRRLTIATLIVAFVFLFAFNAFVGGALRNLALDLTADREFTLSEGSERVMKALEEPVTLRLFVSPALVERAPVYALAAERVRNLLNRYVALSNGRIRLETYRPEPYSQDEDKAVAYGLEGVLLDESGARAYFGLAGTNMVDEEETIAFFHPSRQRLVEYDIARMVYSLGVKKQVIGLISGLQIDGGYSMQGGAQQPWPIYSEFAKQFDVETVDPTGDSIPDKVDVLMIVHPRRLGDRMLYAIDQFVMKGGRALVVLDPVPESAPRQRTFMGAGPVPPGSELPKLLEAWGVAYDAAAVATDANRALPMPYRHRGQDVQVPHIAYVQMRKADMAAADPVTARLETLIFGTPGHFAAAQGGTTTVAPLVSTTGSAMVRSAEEYRQEPQLVDLFRSYTPGARKLHLAVRVTGSARSAFPDGPPPDQADGGAEGEKAAPEDGATEGGESGEAAPPAHIAAAQKPLDLILVADADFMQVSFWAQTTAVGEAQVHTPFANNAEFVVNALDDLARADPLIGLRGRGSPARPFTVVEDLSTASQNKLRAKQRELAQEMEETRARIDAARTASRDGRTVLTPEQEEALEGQLATFLAIRQQMRAVLSDLRKDVEALEARIKFYNIALIPLMVAVVALLVTLWRARRRRRRYETA